MDLLYHISLSVNRLNHSFILHHKFEKYLTSKLNIELHCYFADTPSCKLPDKSAGKQERVDWLLGMCKSYVEKYVMQNDVSSLVEQTDDLHRSSQEQYQCRSEECDICSPC